MFGRTLLLVTDIMARVGSIFSFAAILISLFVLFEMRKHRRESYKPWLFIKNKNFYLQKNPNGTPCFLKETSNEIQDLYGHDYKLELHNVGLAAAHTIHIKWDYDHKKLLDEFTKLGTETSMLERTDVSHFEYLFGSEKQQGFGFSIRPPAEEHSELAFLRSGDIVNISIPETIKNCMTFVPYLELLSRKMPYRVDRRDDGFSVRFKFLDISGKKHIQTLNIVVETFAYGKEFHGKNYGIGTLSFSTV